MSKRNEKYSGVYRIRNIINKKIYIGSSIDVFYRWKEHLFYLRNNKHKSPHLQSAFNKYGIENFIFEVIMFCSKDKLLFFEQKCLDVYKPYNREIGYNTCKMAGNTLGKTHSEETKRKIGLKSIGRNIVCTEEMKKVFAEYGKKNMTDKKRASFLKQATTCRTPIEKIDPITGEVIEYDGFKHAVLETGYSKSAIWQCCRSNKRNILKKYTYKGFYWQYL